MSKRCAIALAFGAALVLGSGDPLSAQQRGAGGGGGGRGGPPMTPLLYRQHIMQTMQQTLQALTAIRGGTAGAPSHLVARATILQQLAAMLPEAFPAGSGGEGSRALPAIWEDQAGFSERVQAMRTAADALVTAAQSGNADGVAAAQTAAQQACAGCHMPFRGPAPGA